MKKSLHIFILNVLTVLAVLALLPVFIAGGLTYLVAHVLMGWMLRRQFLAKWGREGKRMLVVYSGTRDWQQHIEERWVPALTDRAVMLRWSGSREWKLRWPLESRIMRHWGGDREYNPMAIVFPRLGRVRVLRFWRAFKERKRGKEQRLRKTEAELFRLAHRLRKVRR